jgi:hypothetical protein
MSEYTEKYHKKEPKERSCGELHPTIEDAIIHCQTLMDCRQSVMEPYRGTTRQNDDVVVGYALSSRRRWRLDYSDVSLDGKPPKWVHVNAEDFDAPPGFERIVHLVDSKRFELVDLYYKKWTSRYGRSTRP